MRSRKGIVLAGGSGTRLSPLTTVVSKQLLPVFNKPMVYYPIHSLILAGIRDILIITRPIDLPLFKRLLGDGNQWGVTIEYAEQPSPDGLAQALLIAETFLDGAPAALILGDNLFHGGGLKDLFIKADQRRQGATIFLYQVANPKRYGVAEMSDDGRVIGIEEKPMSPRSSMAVTGLYFFDEHAPEMAKGLKPSLRGELEITDLNNLYITSSRLHGEDLGNGTAWFDAGTFESLIAAGNYFQSLEHRLGMPVGSPEQAAIENGWLKDEANDR